MKSAQGVMLFRYCVNSNKLILGNFNAKVACEDKNENIGKYGLHTECNDNGRRLVRFATSHGMTIGGTLFLRKDIHKAMWKSPSGTHRNQIMF
jgi:hypothetical protein